MEASQYVGFARNSTRRKYWDEDYVKSLEDQIQSLLAALKATSRSDEKALANAVVTYDETSPDVRPLTELVGGHAATEPQQEYNWSRNAIPDQATNMAPEAPTVLANSARSNPVQDRSEAAMEELSVMMWRTNIGDGVTIISDDATGSDHRVEEAEEQQPPQAFPVNPPEVILHYCRDLNLVRTLASSFLANINTEHMFTSYRHDQVNEILHNYPHGQPRDLVFLHSAMLASGATFSSSSSPNTANGYSHDTIAEHFAQYAESLVFTCFREAPTVAVVQGLCILSERALALGRDQFGWSFISMAAGISVHLRLHVLALDECSARSWTPSREAIRTFWMFYMTDRTAISILGRNCVLPWRRVNVPNFDTTMTRDAAHGGDVDIGEVSFAWQCRLWYLHDNYMDQIFSSNFEVMPHAEQVQLLVSTHDALRTFFQGRDRRLDLVGASTSKHVLFFHLAYQIALLITLPPFLRCFASPNAPKNIEGKGNVMVLILRSLTSAASTTVRLVRMYRDLDPDHWTAAKPNPVIIHHLLSAAIVQLMNATSSSASLRRRSSRGLRLTMDMLTHLRVPWRVRADKSIKVIRVLAQRWGVLGSLPLNLSYRVDPSTGTDALEAAEAMMMMPGQQQQYMEASSAPGTVPSTNPFIAAAHVPGGWSQDSTSTPTAAGSIAATASEGMAYFPLAGALPAPVAPFPQSNNFDLGQSATADSGFDIFQAFANPASFMNAEFGESLLTCENFDWLVSNEEVDSTVPHYTST
ncbi:hypothetical protein IWZ00DRAFT_492179 [Phyllosticta capitalensis]|uniref:Xylanolytic transcriptional activator regulatory domain-containing protein n=1 Tax=Phyllosticta capitalensis TaxID=121624 RepID=A0ABR1YM71_9PEZI